MILGDGAIELLNVLFPHLAGIHVERVVASDRSVRPEAATRGSVAVCSACGQASNRVHSRYERSLADCGVGGREVTILPLSEQHVRSVLAEFVAYYIRNRPHRSLGLETPVARRRPVYREVVSRPVLGGLHHVYERAA